MCVYADVLKSSTSADEKCLVSHSLTTYLFSFCVPPQPHPHTSSLQITRLQNSDDIRVAGQSHGVILKAQHRQTTSLKSKRQSPLRSLKFPTVITSRASRFPCEILPTAFFSTKNKREEKKTEKQKDSCLWGY